MPVLSDGKLKIALYRAKRGNWVDTGINFFSGAGGFSHCEIVFQNGESFSSTTRNEPEDDLTNPITGKRKKDGTRFKFLDFDPDNWVITELKSGTPGMEPNIEAAYKHARAIMPAEYDYKGVLRFIPFVGVFARQSPDKYFCSEAVVEVAQAAGLLLHVEPYLVSPNRLAKILGVRT